MHVHLKSIAIAGVALVSGTLLMGATTPRNQSFDIINVKRINVV